MKLVFVTQTLDPGHAALAQTLDLVEALAQRVEQLDVVARTSSWSPPANVRVRTFEAPYRALRAASFELALLPSLRDADGVLVHMVPEFMLLTAPLARVRRIPALLWYTHWHAGSSLRLATGLADRVLSVDRASFPLETPKLRGIGHAIDVARFDSGAPRSHDGPAALLAVGRTARWKGLATLLDALTLARAEGVDATLDIRGPSLTPEEEAHRAELERRIEGNAELRGFAHVLPAVPRSEMPSVLAAADVIVSPNEPRSGATFDKAVFEAAACARPVISTNRHFAGLLGGVALPLLPPPRDPRALADSIAAVVRAGPAERAAVGEELRGRVSEQHSLDHWADAVIENVTELRSARGG
jgi:glycosyltransferase involved in cell wall biosynthesis